MSKLVPINKTVQDMGEEFDDLASAMNETLGLDKTKSADCVQAILTLPQFSNTKVKDWKRKSKKKVGGNWVRVFENKVTGQIAEITESKGGVIVSDGGGAGGGGGSQGQSNSTSGFNGVSLLPLIPDYPPSADVHWTGRCVFSIEEGEDDEVNFYCGPEDDDGGINDSYSGGIDPKLQAIFSDFGDNVMIQNAENYHTVYLTDGQDQATIENLVIQRLTAAGAIPYGSPMAQTGNVNSPIYYAAIHINWGNCDEWGAGDIMNMDKYAVGITDKGTWDTEGHQSDETPQWMQEILATIPFPPEEMENFYLLTQQQIEAVRANPNFFELPAFKEFMNMTNHESD